MHLSPSLFLLVIGGVIVFGFFAEVIFRRFGVAPVLPLIAVGFLMAGVMGWVDPAGARAFAPYFGAVAFAIILFTGGITFNPGSLMRTSLVATLFTSLTFALSVGAVALLWKLMYGNVVEGIGVGIMVGGTSGAVVVPVVERLGVSEYVKGVAVLESVLTDVLVVVGFSVLATVVSGGVAVNPGMRLLQAFGIAAVVGAVVGFLWLQAMRFVSGTGLSFTTTLGVLLLTYGVVELMGGSGPFSSLVLGLTLSNARHLGRILREDALKTLNLTLDTFTRRVSEEVSFLVRTFFFLLLGLAVDPSVLSSVSVVLGILALFFVLVAVRYPVARLLGWALGSVSNRDALLLWSMMPRGLASAVVAFSLGAVFPGRTEVFVAYALGIIVLSVLLMTVGVFLFGRGEGVVAPGGEAEG